MRIKNKMLILILILLSLFMIGAVSAASDTEDIVNSDVNNEKVTTATTNDVSDSSVEKTSKSTDIGTSDSLKKTETIKDEKTSTNNDTQKKTEKDTLESESSNLLSKTRTNTLKSTADTSNDILKDSAIIEVGSWGDLKNNIKDGYVIKLTKNLTTSGEYITIDNGKVVTINGNGHTIDAQGRGDDGIFKVYGATLILENLKLINGKSENEGGAIYAENSNITITTSTLQNNTSDNHGGAIYTENSQVNITTSTLQNNTSDNCGGAIYTENSQVNINNSTLQNNNAYWGGAINAEENSNITITTSTLQNNQADDAGGAIYISNSQVNITRSIIQNNNANYNGGAINAEDNSDLTVNHNIFLNNTGNKIIYLYKPGTVNLDYNWFGNTLDNYTVNPGVDIDNWLFLNATANPKTILPGETSEIIFRLESTKVKNYDNKQLKPVNLTITNNNLDKNVALLGENITYTATNSGIDGVTASICGVSYTQEIKVSDSSFAALYKNITNQNTITLDHDYTYDPDTDTKYTNGMEINKELIIIGNGHTISGNNTARIFRVTDGGHLTLENITLTKGKGQEEEIIFGRRNVGGAIYIDNATVTIINTTLQNNTATEFGGAIYTNLNSNINITNSILQNNQVPGDAGGAISVCYSNITINNSTLQNNHAYDGGAIHAYESRLNITTSTLTNNTATYDGGAITASTSNVTIINTTLQNNTATEFGGAIIGKAYSNISITTSTLQNNHATGSYGRGGAITASTSNVTIINTTLQNNHATGPNSRGGAIYTESNSQINITNSTLQNNHATEFGGVIFAAFYSKISVTSNLFLDNSANSDGSAIYGKWFDDLTVNHNIFLNNTGNNIIYLVNDTDDDYKIDYNLDYNWFGNNATDYNVNIPAVDSNVKNLEFNNWLFLNATISNPVIRLDPSEITFKLYSYTTNNGGEITNYDNSKLNQINLTITTNNGYVEPIAILGKPITYRANTIGEGSITASIGDINYTKEVNVASETSFTALYNNITNQNTITLDHNYTYDNTTDQDLQKGIIINKTVHIIGNGYTISGNNSARIFNVTNGGHLTLENITLTKGQGQKDIVDRSSKIIGAGAIYANNAKVTLINTTLTNNTASERGGAIYVEDNSQINITQSTLTNNTASEGGGAIYVEDNSQINITQSTIQNNQARYGGGGAIYTDNSKININNSTLTNNTATHYGGAIYTNNAKLTLINTTLQNNKATGGYSNGGAIFASDKSHININNSTLQNNNAGDGGAIYTGESTIIIINTQFKNNNANNGNGGAIYVTYDTTVNNCTFTNNTAGNNGGAIHVNSGNAYIKNTKFTNNTAGNNGGAIFTYYYSKISVIRNLFFNNSRGSTISGWNFDNLTVNHNIFLNNTRNNIIDLNNPGTVNLDYNWFGHNATDYTDINGIINDNSYLNNWLFLNATAKPNTILPGKTSQIIFRLDSTTEPNYDNNQLKPVNLTIKSKINSVKNVALLGEYITYTATNSGIDGVTASIGGVSYTQKIKVASDDSFTALYENITKYNTLTLDHDYIYDSSTDTEFQDGIPINKTITINGNGHSISGNNTARIFNVKDGSNLTLENLNINNGKNTYDGGAIRAYYSNISITNCNFTQNNAKYYGGAIRAYYSNISITNCNFTQNNASHGGAIYTSYSQINITQTNFNNNTATDYGGAISASYSNITITQTNFNNNNATQWGGAISASYSYMNMTQTNFNNNTATDYGGAIYAIYSYMNMTQTNFNNNTANHDGAGGAIAAWNSNINITQTNFNNNTATYNGVGGAIYTEESYININNSTLQNNNATQRGGAISASYSYMNITQSILTNNTATSGGAIYTTYKSKISITSSLFMDNNADVNGSAIYGLNFDELIVNHNIFLNNTGNNAIYLYKDTEYSSEFVYNFDYNWFGNTADNYTNKPNIEFKDIDEPKFDNWLFLNATADPDLITVLSSSNITFELFLYNSSSKNVTIYDNSQLKPVNLTITYTNGIVDKKIAKLNETIGYTPENSGISSVTASIGGVSYTKVIKAIKDTSYTALYNNINQSTDPVTIIILTQDYIYDPNTDTEFQDGILIKKTVIIKGDGHSISGNNTASIFHITDNGNLTLENITLTNGNGLEGGAISAINANVTIINSTLTNNTAMDYGGAIYAGASNVTIINSTLINNSATYDGGAIYSGESNLTMTNTTMTNNTAGENGGAIAIDAINAIQTNIIDSTFINNNATQWGGAIYTNSDLTVENSLFEDNNASRGSGAFINNALFTSKNNTFINNTVDGDNYKIRPRDPQISIKNIDDITEGNPVTITVTADEEFSTELVLNVNGNNYTVKMINGKGQITVSDLKPGTYTAKIQFDGNENYTNTTVTSNSFKVNTKPAPSPSPAPAGKQNTKIIAKNKVYKPAKYRTYTVTVKNKKGKPVKNTKVKLKVGKKTYIRKTNKKGVATFKIKNTKKSKKSKKTKKYSKITATLNKKNKKDKLILTRGSKTNKATANNKGVTTFKIKNSKTKTRKYTITLKTTSNKIIKKQKITLKVKGKTFKAKTNSKGKATFKITNLNKKGKYKTTIKYNGNSEYNKSTKKVKITIKE